MRAAEAASAWVGAPHPGGSSLTPAPSITVLTSYSIIVTIKTMWVRAHYLKVGFLNIIAV